MTQIVFLASAEDEVRAAEAWYHERDPDVAARFRSALARAIDQIRQSPERWPVSVAGARRVRLHRFPYAVHYRADANQIVVAAVAHRHRRPGYWRAR